MQNQDYIHGLLSHNQKIIDQIYQTYFDRIKHLILKQNGTIEDAKDVFQEALIVIYKKAQTKEFTLNSQFSTYLYGICKFIWFNIRKKKANQSVTLEGEMTSIINEDSIEETLLQQERYQIYEENLQKIGKVCQQILELFFTKKSMGEIATIIGYKNPHVVRTQKHKCQQRLKALIKADKRFMELTSSE